MPHLLEDPVRHRRVLLEAADDHELDVEELVDVGADLPRDVVDYLGELFLHPLVDALPEPAREVAPEGRVLALHDPLHVADVPSCRVEAVLGDLVRLELLVEVAGAAELGVSTAMLPIFAAREGMIPCQPTPPCITPGICWNLRGSSPARAFRPGKRNPLNRTGLNSIQTPLQFVR
jgi:hypothetical protein